MNLITVKELYRNTDKYIDQTIEVGGWVRNIRDSKTFGFIVLNDGTFFETLQVVFHDTMDNFAEICKLNVGAAIIVKGKLVATPQAKQKFEIQAEEVFVEGPSTPDYPVQPKRHSMEFLPGRLLLKGRSATESCIGRIPAYSSAVVSTVNSPSSTSRFALRYSFICMSLGASPKLVALTVSIVFIKLSLELWCQTS